MARQFYETVTGRSIFASTPPSNVILTGHSLGAGLAGSISVLSGAKAVGFDHMRFGVAAIAEYVSEVYRRLGNEEVTPPFIPL